MKTFIFSLEGDSKEREIECDTVIIDGDWSEFCNILPASKGVIYAPIARFKNANWRVKT